MARLRSYRRFLVVLRYFVPLSIAYLRDRRRFLVVGGSRSPDKETQRERAEYLLESLLALGPTFIKLGQLLSTRPDVLPPAYVEVLSQLQDSVPAAPWEEIEQVLEEDLGPVDEQFDTIDTEPISGASLGQVHRAQIDGEAVAVKIRRPGVNELVEADLQALRWLVPLVRRFVDDARIFSFENLVEEFDETIREEMDYAHERAVLTEIRENFADTQEIIIPRAIESHASQRVLTMEYVSGTKITDLQALDEQGIDKTALADRLARAYMEMMVEHGRFHADPHPGNLAVKEDGRIVFYDFGMSGEVDAYTQQKLVEFYQAVVNNDVDGILDVMVDIGALAPTADRTLIRDVVELAIANARGRAVDQRRVQRLIQQFQTSMYQFPFRLPQELALILRVGSITEGVCVTLDPEFDFIAAITEYLSEQGYRREAVQQAARAAGDRVQQLGRTSLRLPEKLETVLDTIDRDQLVVTVSAEESIGALQSFAKQLVYGLLTTAGVLIIGILYAFGEPVAAAVAGVGTVLVGLLLYRSFGTTEPDEIAFEPAMGREQIRQYTQTTTTDDHSDDE